MISDTTFRVLRANGKTRGPKDADDMAAGYYDGASRYLSGEKDDADKACCDADRAASAAIFSGVQGVRNA